MKRKHWHGYGTVNARVLKRDDDSVVIKVTGTHEQGLCVNIGDTYMLAKWLGTKSLGNFTDSDVQSFSMDNSTDDECIYEIKLKVPF